MKEKNGKPLIGAYKQNLRGGVITVLVEMARGERIANLRDPFMVRKGRRKYRWRGGRIEREVGQAFLAEVIVCS